MQALQLQENATEPLVFNEVAIPETEMGKALVKLTAVALNHRDQWIREGKYPNIQLSTTLGSDGCGIVEKVGGAEDQHWVGKEVVINPNIGWGDEPAHQAKDYRILGNPDNGTFAEYLVIDVDRLAEKPSTLSTHEAAAVPLAGLTAYRAVFTQSEVNENDTVLISGIGGGVAQFAFQFALATGAKVFVTSGDDQKIEKAKQLGASGGVNYKSEGWSKQLLQASGGFTKIIDSAGGDQMNQLIKLLKPTGRLTFYGATLGLPNNLDLYKIFYNQLRIQGTTMGNDIEFKEMLAFVDTHQIKPIIDEVMPFTHAIAAFDKMQAGNQFGKIVLTFDPNYKKSQNKLKNSVEKVKDFFSGLWRKKSD